MAPRPLVYAELRPRSGDPLQRPRLLGTHDSFCLTATVDHHTVDHSRKQIQAADDEWASADAMPIVCPALIWLPRGFRERSVADAVTEWRWRSHSACLRAGSGRPSR